MKSNEKQVLRKRNSKTFKRFSFNQTKKSFSKESSQRLTPMIDKQATKHFCELTPFKWWKLNKNKMCSKSILTIKSSNESPKYQKTSFKKMVTNNFPETKEQMVTKMVSLSKQKGHQNKMNTKIESNLPTLPKQSSQDS